MASSKSISKVFFTHAYVVIMNVSHKNLYSSRRISNEQRDRIIKRENEVLRVCCFQLNFHLPFDFISPKSDLISAVRHLPLQSDPKAKRNFCELAKQVATHMFATVSWYVLTLFHICYIINPMSEK